MEASHPIIHEFSISYNVDATAIKTVDNVDATAVASTAKALSGVPCEFVHVEILNQRMLSCRAMFSQFKSSNSLSLIVTQLKNFQATVRIIKQYSRCAAPQFNDMMLRSTNATQNLKIYIDTEITHH